MKFRCRGLVGYCSLYTGFLKCWVGGIRRTVTHVLWVALCVSKEEINNGEQDRSDTQPTDYVVDKRVGKLTKRDKYSMLYVGLVKEKLTTRRNPRTYSVGHHSTAFGQDLTEKVAIIEWFEDGLS